MGPGSLGPRIIDPQTLGTVRTVRAVEPKVDETEFSLENERQFSAAAPAAAAFQNIKNDNNINKQLESLAQESLLARSIQYLGTTPKR